MEESLPQKTKHTNKFIVLGAAIIVALGLAAYIHAANNSLQANSNEYIKNLSKQLAQYQATSVSSTDKDKYIALLEEASQYILAQQSTLQAKQMSNNEELALSDIKGSDQEVAGLSTQSLQQFLDQQAAKQSLQQEAQRFLQTTTQYNNSYNNNDQTYQRSEYDSSSDDELPIEQYQGVSSQQKTQQALENLSKQQAFEEAVQQIRAQSTYKSLPPTKQQQAVDWLAEVSKKTTSQGGIPLNDAVKQWDAHQKGVKSVVTSWKNNLANDQTFTNWVKSTPDSSKVQKWQENGNLPEILNYTRSSAKTAYNAMGPDQSKFKRSQLPTEEDKKTYAEKLTKVIRTYKAVVDAHQELISALKSASQIDPQALPFLLAVRDLQAKEKQWLEDQASLQAALKDQNVKPSTLVSKIQTVESGAKEVESAEKKVDAAQSKYDSYGLPSGSAADLVVSSFVLTDKNGKTKTTFAPNERIYVKYIIKNQGTDTAKNQYTSSGMIWSQIYGDKSATVQTNAATDVNIYTKNGSSSGSGKSASFASVGDGSSAFPGSKSFTVSKAGIYTARVFVNYDHLAIERDYTNNQATVKYTIMAPKDPSDLTVSSFKLVDASGAAKNVFKVNEPIYITLTNANIGSADAYTANNRIVSQFFANKPTTAKTGDTSDVTISLNNGLYSKGTSKTYSSIPGSKTAKFFAGAKSFTMKKAGKYTARIFIDYTGGATETNEKNNQVTLTYTVVASSTAATLK